MQIKRTTSISFNDDDYVKRLELDKKGVSVIDTWRAGANLLLSIQKGKNNDISIKV